MKRASLYIDFTFCILVLPVMALIFPVERWFHNFPYYVTAIMIWLYSVYILNRSITVPLLFRCVKKRLIGVSLIVISLLVTLLLSRVNLYDPKPNIYDAGIIRIFPSVLQYQQAVWSLFMIVETFSFAVGLLTQVDGQKSRRLYVQAQRDKAELALYKAQIKPHFMFNTLNSLYGLFLTNDHKALPSLEKYISMLRYVYSTSRQDFVSLSDEVEYIRQYVGLQSLRLTEMTVVDLRIQMENEAICIPPMLLVTFVENCFKYGVSPVEESSISIQVTELQGVLTLYTENRIFHSEHTGERMGISNCKKRLDLIYPDKYSLKCDADGIYYRVILKINMK